MVNLMLERWNVQMKVSARQFNRQYSNNDNTNGRFDVRKMDVYKLRLEYDNLTDRIVKMIVPNGNFDARKMKCTNEGQSTKI